MKSQDYKNIFDQMHEELKKFSATSDTLSGYGYEQRFRETTDEYNKKLFQTSQGRGMYRHQKIESIVCKQVLERLMQKKRTSLESSPYGF